jgi:hypothetical protein
MKSQEMLLPARWRSVSGIKEMSWVGIGKPGSGIKEMSWVGSQRIIAGGEQTIGSHGQVGGELARCMWYLNGECMRTCSGGTLDDVALRNRWKIG